MYDYVIIDGNNLTYRVWSALDGGGENNTLSYNGQNVSVLFGFLNMLVYNLQLPELIGKNIILTWDISKSKRRLELYPEYKGNRERDDSFLDYIEQTKLTQKFVECLPVHSLKLKDYEADDIIGAICELHPNSKKVIMSADKDLAQLIDDNTDLFKLGMSRSMHKLITVDNYEEINSKCRIPFNKMIEYKVINGDVSDNIKGVFGVGDKTVEKMFDQYGSINGFLEAYAEGLVEKKSMKTACQKIIDSADIVDRNFKLIDIKGYLGDELLDYTRTELLKSTPYDIEEIKVKLVEYGFNSIINNFQNFARAFQIEGTIAIDNSLMDLINSFQN